MRISIEISGTVLQVRSPYHPSFVQRAHNLAGKWDDRNESWEFDVRDIDRVRKACMDAFGTDGTTPDKLFTMQAKALKDIEVSLGGVFLAGYQIARAWGRDSGAVLGDGVILLEGAIKSGGSRKYWATRVLIGSAIEIKDMTSQQIELARKAEERYGKWEITSVIEQEMEAKIAGLKKGQRLRRHGHARGQKGNCACKASPLPQV